MSFQHDKYPIIIGGSYTNKEGEVGILEYAALYPRKNEAEIRINMNYHGRWYILNYATFTFDWKLIK